jgi:hypothetical protein
MFIKFDQKDSEQCVELLNRQSGLLENMGEGGALYRPVSGDDEFESFVRRMLL